MYSREDLLNYVEALANGVDPNTGEVLDRDTILNRPDIIRMLYAVKDYINEYGPKISRSSREEFVLSNVEGIVGPATSVTNFVKKINEVNCKDHMKPLNTKVIPAWLLKEGYLELDENEKKVPTEKGIAIGLKKAYTMTSGGFLYSYVEYNEEAQKFVLENLKNGNIELDIKKYEVDEETQ